MDYTSLFDLTGKIALVVGPTNGGIGHAQAVGLAQFGADVLLAGSSPEDLRPIASEVEAVGRRSGVFQVEVTAEDSVRALVSAVLAGFGVSTCLSTTSVRVSAGLPSTSRWTSGRK